MLSLVFTLCITSAIDVIDVYGAQYVVEYQALSDVRLISTNSSTMKSESCLFCSIYCANDHNCSAGNYNKELGLCELLYPLPSDLYQIEKQSSWSAFYKDISDLDYKANASVSQGATTWSGYAYFAIDGVVNVLNSGTYRCTHTDNDNTWFMVELGLGLSIRGLVLWNRGDSYAYERLRNLVITVSEEVANIDLPENECGYYDGPPKSINDNPITIIFNRRKTGSVVKIQQNYNDNLSICELFLIG